MTTSPSLMDSVRQGRWHDASIALDQPGWIDERGNVNSDGWTLLMAAAYQSQDADAQAVAERLLKIFLEQNGGRLNDARTKSRGMTTLMLAAASGSSTLVQQLLPWSTVAAVDHTGNNALMLAAASGNRATLEVLLTVGHAASFNAEHKTAFFQAVENRHEALALRLLPLSDVHHRDVFGETALTKAIDTLQPALIDALLSIDKVDTNDGPGHRLKQPQNLLFRLANGHASTTTPLLQPSLIPVVSRLTKMFDPLERNEDGRTPLMLAVYEDNVHAVKGLLACTKDVDLHQDDRGRSLFAQTLLDHATRPTSIDDTIVDAVAVHPSIDPEEVRTCLMRQGWDVAMVTARLPRWHIAEEQRILNVSASLTVGSNEARPRL